MKKGAIKDPRSFIHPVPHMSFVRGPEDVAFLKKRFEAFTAHPCYHGMEYTDDKKRLEEWIPLVMEGRDPDEEVAATRMITGTDVDYGCDNPEITSRHDAKVYGKAAVGAPPMSVPHLDTRHVEGQVSLLFGPYAGFSTKFLKHGSYLDFFRLFDLENIRPLLDVGWDDRTLEKYLIGQLLESTKERFAALLEYYPNAREDDWRIEVAGQRVQIIKKDPTHGGVLEFGTEVVSAADHSIAALLGASPGASTAVWIMV